MRDEEEKEEEEKEEAEETEKEMTPAGGERRASREAESTQALKFP